MGDEFDFITVTDDFFPCVKKKCNKLSCICAHSTKNRPVGWCISLITYVPEVEQ